AVQGQGLYKTVQKSRVTVEAVVEVVWCGAMRRAGKVGRHQAPAVGQPGHQIAELVRRTGVAVRKQHDGRVRRAGLAIEDIDAVDAAAAMAHLAIHGRAPVGAGMREGACSAGGGAPVKARGGRHRFYCVPPRPHCLREYTDGYVSIQLTTWTR